MLTGLHFLLSYRCTHECDHCFVYGSPRAGGTFSLAQIRAVLDQADRIGTIEWIYFEGGEPFLYYPLLRAAIEEARDHGYQVGVVTNSYFGDAEDLELWLEPLRDLGVGDLTVSDDALHYGEGASPAARVRAAAERLGLSSGAICLEPPDRSDDVMLRGRAADRLADGLARRLGSDFDRCTAEELVAPARVHLDAYGNVHICQGISMGNMWQTPLAELVADYRAEDHPVCRYLVAGGPAALAAAHGLAAGEEFVSACHMCFRVRQRLRVRLPDYLGPAQMYGE